MQWPCPIQSHKYHQYKWYQKAYFIFDESGYQVYFNAFQFIVFFYFPEHIVRIIFLDFFMYFFSFFVFFRYKLSVFFSYSIVFCFFFSHILILISPYCVKNVLIRSYSGPYFPNIWTEYRGIQSISPYSVGMWENADQDNSEYRHFLRSTILSFFCLCFILLQAMLCIYRELSFVAFLCFLYNTDYLFRLFFLVFLDGIFFDMS